MNKYLLSIIALSFGLLIGWPQNSNAQLPAWTDYYKRAEMYPESEWITGFVSAVNSNNEDQGKMVEKYESMARDKVVQSIEVEIESQNDLTISNINGKSDEAFLSKSVSFSNAKINGLRTEHYYDKKKNEVYAFSYVNKKELAFYYKNLMAANQKKLEQKLKEGREFLKMGNKEEALRSFYEGMPMLAESDQAHMLLLALNRKMLAEINLQEINQLRLDFNQEINNLQKATELNLNEAAYFVAYGIFIQLGEITSPIYMGETTYLNTGFSSPYSEMWAMALKDALIKAGNYQVKTTGNMQDASLLIVGNYWIQDVDLLIHNRIVKNEELVAVATARIPLKWLRSQQVVYMPGELSRIEKLTQYKLMTVNPEFTVKAGVEADEPLQVRVTYNSGTNNDEAANIPVVFINKQTGAVLCTAKSYDNGIAPGFLPPLGFNDALIEVEAGIDLASYIPIDTNTAYYLLIKKQFKLLPAHFLVHVQKQVYCIQSSELLLGSPMEIKTIEPTVKKALVDLGYQFTDDPSQADFLIMIEASSTTGTNYQGVYFTFVDANISVINQSTNKEVFKTHVDQVTGGGANYTKAGKKAFVNTAEQLKEAVKDYK